MAGAVLVCAACASGGTKREPAPDAAAELASYTARITDELRARDPEAATLFTQANAAREKESLAEAERLYREVLARQPDFYHATRRLADVILNGGRRAEALALLRPVVKSNAAPENMVALISALTAGSATNPPPAADVREAVGQARTILLAPRADRFALLAAGQAACVGEDLPMLRQVAAQLESRFSNEPAGFYLRWLLALSERRWNDAESLVCSAAKAGLPARTVAHMRTATRQAQPWPGRAWRSLWPWAVAWMGLFALLLLTGFVLSAVVSRTAARLAGAPANAPPALSVTLGRTYRGVLWACCIFYYFSLPLVLLAVVALALLLVYACLAGGHVPVKLLLIIVVVAGVTVWSAIKGMLARGRDEDPGDKLDLATQPRLRQLLEDLARRLGTRCVDSVYLTPGTEVAVLERGGMRRQLTGRTERCLVIGLAVLEGMRVGALRAVLAHEYGHFVNRDTAGGGFALAVRRSLLTMAQSMAEGGAATWFNPAWLFLNGFYRVFLRLSHGASRLQEVMADRCAALIAGAGAFEEGLRHVIVRDAQFDAHATAALNEVIKEKKPLANLYRFAPAKPPDMAIVQKKADEHLQATPSGYSTHPAPMQRFAWVKAVVAVPAWPEAEQCAEAWSLFENRDQLERRMTDRVRANIAVQHNIAIPGAVMPGTAAADGAAPAQG